LPNLKSRLYMDYGSSKLGHDVTKSINQNSTASFGAGGSDFDH